MTSRLINDGFQVYSIGSTEVWKSMGSIHRLTAYSWWVVLWLWANENRWPQLLLLLQRTSATKKAGKYATSAWILFKLGRLTCTQSIPLHLSSPIRLGFSISKSNLISSSIDSAPSKLMKSQSAPIDVLVTVHASFHVEWHKLKMIQLNLLIQSISSSNTRWFPSHYKEQSKRGGKKMNNNKSIISSAVSFIDYSGKIFAELKCH